jgi:hypothetical protein
MICSNSEARDLTASKISDAEKNKRRIAAGQAQSNNRIEGITGDPRGDHIVEAFITVASTLKTPSRT